MITLRCTKRLLDRLRVEADSDLPASTGPLGDWYANYVILHRQHLVLAVSEKTLLPVVLPAAPLSTLVPRLVDSIVEMLRAVGVTEEQVEAERVEMKNVTLARTASRSVLGSMNDFTAMLDPHLEGRTPLQAALMLAESPCKPIGWANPGKRTREVFSGA